MNLPKIRASFAAIAAAIAYLVIPSASAAILARNDFEESRADFVADIGGEDASALTAYNEDQPSDTAPYPFSGFGSKYLAVDTGDATIFREFAAQTSSTYLDTFMQFEPTSGEISYTNVAKIVVYLDAATSNLCVISGTAENNRAPITNRLDTAEEGSATVVPGSWGRLTINAIKTSSNSVFKFNVLLNGNTLSAGGTTDTFYSLTDSNAVSRVGFKGTGALDDLVARTSDPFGTAATIDGETYGSLEQALDEANGSTVTLAANHPDAVAVTKSGTYVVDKGSYTFGGVVGTEGSYVSSSSSGSVETYTAKLLVAVWDGATAAYNFSTLTRTLGDTTYTMVVNDANATINSLKDYITIGSENQKWTVKITADAAEAFGSTENSGFTVIAKVANAGTSESANRAILNYYTSTYQAAVSFAQAQNGKAFPMISESAWSASATDGNTLSPDAIQDVALTYDTSEGVRLFVDGTRKWNNGNSTGFAGAPDGLTIGGVPIDNSNKLFALKGMKIYAIAVFSSKLTDDQVATYTFPSETPMSGEVNVSDINALFGEKSEITVHLADGTTVTGDTTFNASTVNFVCDGSFTMTAPAGNTAAFDFSEVTGNHVFVYNRIIPSVSGNTFTSNSVPTWVTDSSQWTGTVEIKDCATSLGNFHLASYGNSESKVCMNGANGYLYSKGLSGKHGIKELIIGVGGFTQNGSYSVANEFVVPCKVTGSGTYTFSAAGAGQKTLCFTGDMSEFAGLISIVGTNNRVLVGASTDRAFTASTLIVGNAGVLNVASGKTWNPSGGMFIENGGLVTNNGFIWTTGGIAVDGELRAPNHKDYFGGGTTITTSDTGVFTLLTNSNVDDMNTDYARITGTGTLRLEGSGYRSISTNNFPTTMTVDNRLTAGFLHRISGLEITIGSLAGDGYLRSDWGGSAGDRNLKVLQAKDTTWSGKFWTENPHRFGSLIVAPGATTSGTLTISATHESAESTGLTIESGAKVNLTGTWVGAVTVNGTLGGTGTITGNVTLSDGAKLKVDDMSDTIEISGSLTVGGTVDVYLPAGTVINKSTQFITTGSAPIVTPGTTFNVYVGETKSALRVAPTANGLKLYRAPIVFLL